MYDKDQILAQCESIFHQINKTRKNMTIGKKDLLAKSDRMT